MGEYGLNVCSKQEIRCSRDLYRKNEIRTRQQKYKRGKKGKRTRVLDGNGGNSTEYEEGS
jgi:hypothetical protein